MEGHKGDKEQDIHRKINVFDPEKDGIWCEMDVENKSSWSWSPCSIFLLTDEHNLALVGRFENEKRVPTEVVKFDKLFLKMQEAHDVHLRASDDDVVIRFAFQLKHSIIDFLVEANKLHGDSHDTPIVKSKSSSHSRSSTFSTSSAKLKFIEAKAKAAELKVKANFLKEKQALRMAIEELELRRGIVEAKAEKKIMSNVTAKLTRIPILSDAQPNSLSTLKVPSVKFQSSAIVSTRRN
ncbi:hypothetical protein pdam_00022493 [Pocillopora damicornis]|uniref:Uncharacterized protein n=1 Tax=Pocillopora damicornis TaxID=46731 RepID=A0A3M6TN22_POCDA|nr:hypothetical protein pdam_00022493 [Pocillopora damicornis]